MHNVLFILVCHFPIGILGQVLYMYLIVSIPDLCTLTDLDVLVPHFYPKPHLINI